MFKLDTSEFAQAVGFVVQATGKDCVEVLNKAGLTALIGGKGVRGAVQRTPKADPVRIEADMIRDKQAIRLVMSRAKKRGEHLTRREISKRVKALIRGRKSGSGYTKGPGWNNAILAMGGKGIRTNKRFAKSEARHGSGIKASAESLVARIISTAPASEAIGFRPLQDALNDTARDMIAYGERKIQATFNKVRP